MNELALRRLMTDKAAWEGCRLDIYLVDAFWGPMREIFGDNGLDLDYLVGQGFNVHLFFDRMAQCISDVTGVSAECISVGIITGGEDVFCVTKENNPMGSDYDDALMRIAELAAEKLAHENA